MKVLLDIPEKRAPFFMELIKELSYVQVLREIKDNSKNKSLQDMAEAFNDVLLHESGQKSLKKAKDLLNEV